MSNRDGINRKLHEMVIIYNAVMNGWTVRKRRDGTLKFTKRRHDEEKETIDIDLEDRELTQFIHEYVNIEDLFRPRQD